MFNEEVLILLHYIYIIIVIYEYMYKGFPGNTEFSIHKHRADLLL